jgi:hypothetical protein
LFAKEAHDISFEPCPPSRNWLSVAALWYVVVLMVLR